MYIVYLDIIYKLIKHRMQNYIFSQVSQYHLLLHSCCYRKPLRQMKMLKLSQNQAQDLGINSGFGIFLWLLSVFELN